MNFIDQILLNRTNQGSGAIFGCDENLNIQNQLLGYVCSRMYLGEKETSADDFAFLHFISNMNARPDVPTFVFDFNTQTERVQAYSKALNGLSVHSTPLFINGSASMSFPVSSVDSSLCLMETSAEGVLIFIKSLFSSEDQNIAEAIFEVIVSDVLCDEFSDAVYRHQRLALSMIFKAVLKAIDETLGVSLNLSTSKLEKVRNEVRQLDYCYQELDSVPGVSEAQGVLDSLSLESFFRCGSACAVFCSSDKDSPAHFSQYKVQILRMIKYKSYKKSCKIRVVAFGVQPKHHEFLEELVDLTDQVGIEVIVSGVYPDKDEDYTGMQLLDVKMPQTFYYPTTSDISEGFPEVSQGMETLNKDHVLFWDTFSGGLKQKEKTTFKISEI